METTYYFKWNDITAYTCVIFLDFFKYENSIGFSMFNTTLKTVNVTKSVLPPRIFLKGQSNLSSTSSKISCRLDIWKKTSKIISLLPRLFLFWFKFQNINQYITKFESFLITFYRERYVRPLTVVFEKKKYKINRKLIIWMIKLINYHKIIHNTSIVRRFRLYSWRPS